MRRLEERLTSLLGWSRSLPKEGRGAAGSSSKRDEEEAALPCFPRDILDMRLSQDELGLASLRSVEDSLSDDVQGLGIPCRLTELSRDSTSVVPDTGRISS